MPTRPVWGQCNVLKTLKLTNFRCFQAHQIEFGPLNVAVGHNNAGKSTVAEALRIVSIVTERFRNINAYREPPSWLTLPRVLRGFTVALDNLEINFDAMFHRYGEPPAMIEADFGGSGRVRVYVGGAKRVHCVLYDGRGSIVDTRDRARRLRMPTVSTLPQVGPVAATERVLNPDYVRASLSSRLAPTHFRNQLNLLYEVFPSFQATVEETWPGLQVKELVGEGAAPGEELHLEVRDGDFVAEVSLMGHGVQMWLQTMWFLSRVARSSTIVLDEPDVYMHADLQRKLIRLIREKYRQVIITTHSTEIMAEVPPEGIVVIDKTRPTSGRAVSLPAVQRVIASLGSVHNVHLARLWATKKFLLVEGKDRRLLKAFQDVLFPASPQPIDGLPNASIGGWGGWRYALGTSLALENAAGKHITIYCILDSDFHSPKQIAQLRENFAQRGVQLHIWRMKEIENYLLIPAAIERAVSSRLPAGRGQAPTAAEIEGFMLDTAAKMQDECLEGAASEFLSDDRSLGAGGAIREARSFLARRSQQVGPLGYVSGKDLISALSGWSQGRFGVALSPLAIAQATRPEELDFEVHSLIGAIEHGHVLDGSAK